ncbi:unnamed protein product [Symbiodinium natans]|uniref:Uncharacterized protein n=1 Tax=Symbiodinium natans TaxID=878477 RepID=A0A812R880_9DINO|nr:unnamed protein product [Symbiodinium natans]
MQSSACEVTRAGEPGREAFQTVGAYSDDEPPLPQRAVCSRRAAALCAVLGLTAVLGVTLAQGSLLQQAGELLRHPLSLWSSRHIYKHPTVFTECVWDSTIAASYLLRGGFELAEAASDCPNSREITFDNARRLLDKHPEIHVPPSGYFPGVVNSFGGHVPTVANASKQAEAACARAQDTLNSLHLRRPHLRKNHSYVEAVKKLRERGMLPQAEELARRLREEGPLPEAWVEREAGQVVNQLCTAQIAGTIAAWSWVAGYLSSATSECARDSTRRHVSPGWTDPEASSSRTTDFTVWRISLLISVGSSIWRPAVASAVREVPSSATGRVSAKSIGRYCRFLHGLGFRV